MSKGILYKGHIAMPGSVLHSLLSDSKTDIKKIEAHFKEVLSRYHQLTK